MKTVQKSLILCAALLSPSLFATGLSKSVLIGPKAVGMGGAFVGIADDATAVFHNPAGITQLEGTHFFLGADALITDLDYTPTGGSTESANGEFLVVPNFSVAGKLTGPLYFGFGVFFPHGNGGEFDGASAQPFNPNKGRIYSMEITPSLAIKLQNGLSFGASLRVVRASNELEGQNLLVDPTDLSTLGSVNDLETSGWGLGFSAGVHLKPIKEFSWGLLYRSRVNVDMDGDLDATFDSATPTPTAFDGGVSFEQTLPTVIHTGFGFYPCDALSLGLSYQYELNSQIDAFEVTPDGLGSIALEQNWRNSKTIHVGANYKLSDVFAVRAGYAKDLNAAIPDAANNRITGDIAAHETSLGFAVEKGNASLGLTWNGRFGKRTVEQATGFEPAPGEYEAFLHSISLGLGYQI